MGRLTGKTALVTGASRGLGAGIARALAQDGARVVVNYFASGERAEQLCEELRFDGAEAVAIGADVRVESEVQRLMQETAAIFGIPDILVANATGFQPMLAIEDQTWQSYLDQMEFFVKSPLLLLQSVLPQWKEKRAGRFIQIGSEVVELGNPRFASYVAAKAAQLGQTRSWARELGPYGITVNLVAPGWIPTDRRVEESAEARSAYLDRVPLPYEGEAADVGRAVAYLASDDAKFITGQKIAVNGGNTLE